jgi:hypothetical protein
MSPILLTENSGIRVPVAYFKLDVFTFQNSHILLNKFIVMKSVIKSIKSIIVMHVCTAAYVLITTIFCNQVTEISSLVNETLCH